MSNPVEPSPNPVFRRALPIVLGAILAIAASLYAFWDGGNLFAGRIAGAGGQCRAASALAARLAPLARGEVAALQVASRPEPAVPVAFRDMTGAEVTLAAFRGRVLVLNLWATWCAPCRKEMPALDTLQRELGGADFEVVAVNIDTRNFDKPKQFLAETGVRALAYYADPTARIFQDLKAAGRAFGMPTTLVIDREGCELARLAGPAEWASPEALAFVREAIRR
jgi:thiol-disulfide isomerase/thioredoxin